MTVWTNFEVVRYLRAVDEPKQRAGRDVPGPEVAASIPDAARDATALLAGGDRKGAIAVLMDTHGDAVFAFCARILRDAALAEDVLQQVFLEAYRDLEQFQGRSSLRAWLFRIATHRCHDAIRSRQRRQRVIDPDTEAVADHADPVSTAAERLDRSALVGALDDCLKLLSEEVRMTVLLRFQSEMSYQEMSAPLGARSEALHARVARALPVLRRCLEGKGWRHG
jgi:RNA polymerase sigma-70 factor (ECF subfamily)